jgi:hypothetical protein
LVPKWFREELWSAAHYLFPARELDAISYDPDVESITPDHAVFATWNAGKRGANHSQGFLQVVRGRVGELLRVSVGACESGICRLKASEENPSFS